MTVLTTALAVNSDRLNLHIDQLAELGKLPHGGIRRLAFSPEDCQARQRVRHWMEQAGMSVRVDAAGNMIGRYAGRHPKAPAIATGSHIDTVPAGGRYDGVLGVLAGIEVVQVLHEQGLRLDHPIEVIVFSDEESSMIGSRAIAGAVKGEALYHPEQGTSIQACLDAVGGDWSRILSARRSREDMAAFVELHVEQGSVLDSKGYQIGVVEGVVGMHRYAITITGVPNHAGTTPMDMRHDALVAAAHITLAVQTIALEQPSRPVATVGSLNVSPNAANIVPGRVELTVDMRDLSQDCLDDMTYQLSRQLRAIAAKTHTEIDMTPILKVKPSPAAEGIKGIIQDVCQDLGLSAYPLPSRAGHDAMELGHITDMGMIFVPSHAGISHSDQEYTSPEQCTQGANVLLQTLMRLDKAYPIA
jgi:N-carbamoyl-L-amino-acid hydrolase